MAASSPEYLTFYPFAYALFNEHLGTHCWYCLDVERTHRRCTACQSAVFCDKECQLLGWKDHKHECTAIKALKSASGVEAELPDIEVRLLGRIVPPRKFKAIATGKDKADENFYRDRQSRRNLMDIWAHTEMIRKDGYAMQRFNEIYESLIRFYPAKALLPWQAIFEIHCRDFINRHAISDKAYMQEIGKGLYLDLCAYDHSCRPNTIYMCSGFVAHLRPLHSDVNLLDRSSTFYSYIDLVDSKQARRKLLKDTWYFHCECARCVDNAEHLLTSILCPHCPTAGVNSSARLCLFGDWPYKDGETQLITCLQCDTQLSQQEVLNGVSAMRYIGDLLDGKIAEEEGVESGLQGKRCHLRSLLIRFESILPRVNVYYCKLIQALVPLVPLENDAELLQLHLDAEECVRLCYPHNHPALGFHMRNIGIFSRNLGHLPQALKYLREAVAIFNFTMGCEHFLSVAGKRLLDEVEGEAAARDIQKIGKLQLSAPAGRIEAENTPTANSINVTAPIAVVCESGGVKKKASLKKISPRARTPLPPNSLQPDAEEREVSSDRDERSEDRKKEAEESTEHSPTSLLVPTVSLPGSNGTVPVRSPSRENDRSASKCGAKNQRKKKRGKK